jgi:integrase
MPLTDREIAGLKPPASGRREESDGRHGLVVRITAKGEKTFGVWWRIPRRFGGPDTKGFVTLGAVGGMSLKDARERAAEIAEIADSGTDPRAELRRRAETKRQAEAQGDLTVLRVVERHLAARRPTLRPGTLDQYDRTLALLRDLALAGRQLVGLKRGDVREALRIVYRDRGPGTARKMKTLIRGAARWAAAEDLVPHDVLSGLQFTEAEPKVRDRVLSDEEILTLWRACDDAPPIMAASVRLQVVLALRHPSETTGMRWSDLKETRLEIHRGAVARVENVTVYEMPGARRKHGIPLSLPLPPLAIKLLEELKPLTGSRELVLDGWSRGRELHWWRRTIKRRLAEAKVENVTRHDLRRSAASGMTRIGVPASAADTVLGHVLKGSARSYMHGARLVEAASALWHWSDHLERLVGLKKRGAEVLSLVRT